jgi:hypothetical protein
VPLPASAAATPAAAAVPAAAPIFLRPGFIDVERPTVEFPTVEPGDGLLGLAIVGHFDEPKTPGSSGFAVGYQAHTVHSAVRLEQGSNCIFGSSEAQISYKNIFHIAFFLNLQSSESRGRIGGHAGLCEKPKLADSKTTYIMARVKPGFNPGFNRDLTCRAGPVAVGQAWTCCLEKYRRCVHYNVNEHGRQPARDARGVARRIDRTRGYEVRIEDKLMDAMRQIETNILTAFHGYARGVSAHLHEVDAGQIRP